MTTISIMNLTFFTMELMYNFSNMVMLIQPKVHHWDLNLYSDISGSDIIIKIHPTVGTAVTANILSIETHGTNTGVDTTGMIVTNLSSYYKSVSTITIGEEEYEPVAVEIASYNDPFIGEYFMVTVHDTLNDEYELFECHVLDGNNQNINKYTPILILYLEWVLVLLE